MVVQRLWAIVIVSIIAAPVAVRAADAPLTYEADVRPILKAHCFHCHGEGDTLKGGLDLRLRRLMAAGGESGPAIAPGSAANSRLYQFIRDQKMPKADKKLTAEEVALIGRWIDAGAPTAHAEPEQVGDGLIITEQERSFWAFQPIRRPTAPLSEGADSARVRNPIDAFVLARLQHAGLSLSPDADKATLIRRATFDLTGLPPTPAQIDAFIADTSPDAYEKLIDRLLDSPAYGERWGRHWLDVAGYADSEGYSEADPLRPYAWKYRDYVIRAFNSDKPWDRFIIEQLAGDELIGRPLENLSAQEIEKLTATGFLRMAPDGTGSRGVDEPVAANQTVADTIQIVSTSLMGLTMQCAQCHHHRYDPISHEDYYRMRAVFDPAFHTKKWKEPKQRLVSLYTDEDRRKAAEIEAEAKAVEAERTKKQKAFIDATFEKKLAKLPETIREEARQARDTAAAKRTPAQKKLMKEHPSLNVSAGSLYLYDKKAADELEKMADEAAAIRARKPKEDFIRALTENKDVPSSHLFIRGDHEQLGPEVQPADLTVLGGITFAVDDPALPTTGRRLAFARRLTDQSHPLTARVLVNRFWMHHFGRGIVGTVADFGALGDKPTHPELLDYLAGEFIDGGWKLKRLHKLIMTSTTYRQASQRRPEADRIDPDNLLLWRMPVRRLEAEVVRDALLAVSGTLERKRFGEPAPVTVDEAGQYVIGEDRRDNAGRFTKKATDLGAEANRRSIYVQVRRSMPLSVLDTFDAPAMQPNCEVRASSTVAPQSLMLMNSPQVVEQARDFAQRLEQEAGPDVGEQVRLAWRLAFGTSPTSDQVADAAAFIEAQATQFAEHPPAMPKGQKPNPRREALASYCHALVSSNRFLYVD